MCPVTIKGFAVHLVFVDKTEEEQCDNLGICISKQVEICQLKLVSDILVNQSFASVCF